MDFVNRIKIFLQEMSISVTQFADACNISRPTISQILNYRNKRISDEIVTKIHAAFPQLSVYWLLFGEGSMFYGDSIERNVYPSLESNIRDNTTEYPGLFNSQADIKPNIKQNTTINQKSESNDVQSSIISPDLLVDNKKFEKINLNTQSRIISKIVVFYNDNSFESFGPSEV